jgi:hypothetical protein
MKTMKHIFAMAAAIALASAFTACTNDAVMNEEAPVQEEQEKVTLTVTATQGTRTPDTRLLYTDPNNGTGITVNWGTSEKLGVVNYDGVNVPTISQSNPTLAGTSDGNSNTMNFTGVVNASSGTMEGKYNFYYPYALGVNTTFGTDDSGAYIAMNYSAQQCDLDHPSSYMSDRSLMYTTTAVNPSEGITLKHAAALLRFKLTLPEGAGTAHALYLNTWKPIFKTDAYLYYDEKGEVTLEYKNETSSFSLDLIGDTETGEHTITAYMLLPAVEDFTGLLCKVSVWSGSGGNSGYYSYVYNLTEDDSKTNNDALLPEKVYTFTATLKEDKWAGSNIYWDGEKLTFDDPLTINPAQGLLFKWGSLVGISPVRGNSESTAWTGSEPLYTYGAATNPSTGAWSSIESYTGATQDGDVLPLTNDICYKISEGYWRIPTKDDLATLTAAHANIGGVESVEILTTAEDGTEAIYNKGQLVNNQVYIPASGSRDNNVTEGYGRLNGVGWLDIIWSNAAQGETYAYYFSGYNADNYQNKANAYPIRCIRND